MKLNKLPIKNSTSTYKKQSIKNSLNGLKKKSDSELDIFAWKTVSQEKVINTQFSEKTAPLFRR